MKKMVLLCAAMLACGGLAGCGQHKDNSSAKISSLKAENSSLKAKKSSNHKVKHHRKNSSSSQSTNNNASSTAQTAKGNGSNGTQTAKSSNNGRNGNNDYKTSHPSTPDEYANHDSRNGDWHNDPELWADAQNNDNWQGSMYQNATPQMRYNYIEDNHDYWAARDPNYYNGQ